MNIRRIAHWLSVLLLLVSPVRAADSAFTQAELDQMMAPVALYPDSLLSQMLMASTYPDQVTEAVKWSKDNPDQQGDDAVKAVQGNDWDPSVASLVAFPQVLSMMGEKPDWVRQMGDAFLAQPEAVLDTVQQLRKKAQEAGNLESSEQQKVVVDNSSSTTVIKVEPADPQVIYVPAYNPTVIYGTWWWPAYPPYYYRPAPVYGFGAAVVAGIGFGIGIAITNSIWGGFDWRRHDVNINVNRYNNINVNRRLDVNKSTVSWKRDGAGRNARSGADGLSRNGGRLEGADRRQDYRGRDADRKKAREAMQGKGLDPVAERKKLSGSGGDKVRDKVARTEQHTGARIQDRTDSGGTKRDLRANSKPKRSDNAFSGLGDRAGSRRSAERGAMSDRSFSRRNAGGARAGGRGGRAGGLRR